METSTIVSFVVIVALVICAISISNILVALKNHLENAFSQRIAFARQVLNHEVMPCDTYKQSFPQNTLAGSFGHVSDARLLEFKDGAAIQAASKVAI